MTQEPVYDVLPFLEQLFDLAIDLRHRRFAVVASARYLVAQERLLLLRIEGHRSKPPHPARL
jgi:hypothetical protein